MNLDDCINDVLAYYWVTNACIFYARSTIERVNYKTNSSKEISSIWLLLLDFNKLKGNETPSNNSNCLLNYE